MLSSSSGAAVSHYSDWLAINWAVGYLLLGIAAGVATFAVSMWIVAARDSAGGLSAWAFALGSVAGGIQLYALWALVRHIEQVRWAIALALLVVVVIAALTYQPPARTWPRATPTTPRRFLPGPGASRPVSLRSWRSVYSLWTVSIARPLCCRWEWVCLCWSSLASVYGRSCLRLHHLRGDAAGQVHLVGRLPPRVVLYRGAW